MFKIRVFKVCFFNFVNYVRILPWFAIEGGSHCINSRSDKKIRVIDDFLDMSLATVIIFTKIEAVSVFGGTEEPCEWNADSLAIERANGEFGKGQLVHETVLYIFLHVVQFTWGTGFCDRNEG